jgi:hypothetical protein
LAFVGCGGDDEPGDTTGAGGAAGDGGSGGTTTTTTGMGGMGEGGTTTTTTTGMGGMGGEPSGGGGGGGAEPTECDLSGDGKDSETLPTVIDEDMTLTSDTVWVIEGFVGVTDGATLTIEPCTRIEGTKDPVGVLLVLSDGQIDAVGTADEPILFTSQEAEGERAAGDWGGVVLLGDAPITASSVSKIYEGLSEDDFPDFEAPIYGGDNDDHSSGTMSYVRIEFSGFQIQAEKEVNGLSMAGVGAGTQIDHIMVSNTSDDCFEWWGGAMENADYLICNNPGDDYFDTDEGWAGTGSFWFGRRTSVDAISSGDPNGFEWDSISDGTEPRTNVAVSNVTLCGTGEEVAGGVQYGMVLRELITGEIDNLALLGFDYGIDTRDGFEPGDVTLENSLFWDLAEAIGFTDGNANDTGAEADAVPFTEDDSNNEPEDPPFTLANCNNPNGPGNATRDSDVGAFAGDADWVNGLWVDWAED